PANPSFAMPPMDSTTTQEERAERFGDDSDYMSDPSGTIVIEAPEGTTLTDPEVMADVDSLVEDLKATGALADKDAIVNSVATTTAARQHDQSSCQRLVPLMKTCRPLVFWRPNMPSATRRWPRWACNSIWVSKWPPRACHKSKSLPISNRSPHYRKMSAPVPSAFPSTPRALRILHPKTVRQSRT